jgi:dephospho-CoA kinase
MLRVGLTGGIGSGKSTVAQRFRELGAEVIDADELAREVVAAGSPGLAAVHERFGDAVVTADGCLDRGALGQVVFADPQARTDLEAITHPLIAARTRSLVESAPTGRVVVHDVPLLVEKQMSADYHLTLLVGADEDTRMARLTAGRGFTDADARARIAAQAGERQRRAAADVWLDNNGTVSCLLAQVDALWQDRIVGFNDNLMTGSRSHSGAPALVAHDDSWPSAAARLIGRITAALGERAVAVEHIGSTSVPGLAAKDVIDLQIAVRRLSDADAGEFVKALADKDKGLTHFAKMGISMAKLNGLVNRVATAALQKSCFFCLAPPNVTGGASGVEGRSPPPTPRVAPPSRGGSIHQM